MILPNIFPTVSHTRPTMNEAFRISTCQEQVWQQIYILGGLGLSMAAALDWECKNDFFVTVKGGFSGVKIELKIVTIYNYIILSTDLLYVYL